MKELEASPLGKTSAYRDTYAPELLFPMKRAGKRAEIGVGETLPFVGEDIWNAYEISWLNLRGKPVVAMGCFRVPADSPNLIESKSLKLYLNAFNQTRFAGAEEVRSTIARDLSQAAGAPVSVAFDLLDGTLRRTLALPPGQSLDVLDIDVEIYAPDPALLHCAGSEVVEEVLHSQLLKSNCLVTGQPDWATVCVAYRGPRIEHADLLRYIISFRLHNEFHEQCVERMFMDIRQRCAPERLAVWARYTRRGGLDINPWRASHAGWTAENAADPRQ